MTTIANVEYPKSFNPDFQLLQPGQGLGEQGDAALLDLAKHGFGAALGVPANYYILSDLSATAKQGHIVEYCPNDPGRFGSREKVANWLQKGRVFIGLYDVASRTALHPADLADIDPGQVFIDAYGWFGLETNKHIPTAPITTAYRVGQRGRLMAEFRSRMNHDKFRLGLPLGQLVVAVAQNVYGAEPGQISLETWESNNAANHLYDILGFVRPEGVEPVEDVRPTLREVGTKVNGNVVFLGEKDGKPTKMVEDRRLFKVLAA